MFRLQHLSRDCVEVQYLSRLMCEDVEQQALGNFSENYVPFIYLGYFLMTNEVLFIGPYPVQTMDM